MQNKQRSFSANYFEAILQLRPKNTEILHFVVEEVQKRKDVFISDVKVKKTGFDIYLSSQRFTRTLGKKLKDNFKGEMTISRTLFAKDRVSNKMLYRGTVLFRSEE